MEKELGGECSTYGERVGAFRILVGNPEGRCQLEAPGVEGRIIL